MKLRRNKNGVHFDANNNWSLTDVLNWLYSRSSSHTNVRSIATRRMTLRALFTASLTQFNANAMRVSRAVDKALPTSGPQSSKATPCCVLLTCSPRRLGTSLNTSAFSDWNARLIKAQAYFTVAFLCLFSPLPKTQTLNMLLDETTGVTYRAVFGQEFRKKERNAALPLSALHLTTLTTCKTQNWNYKTKIQKHYQLETRKLHKLKKIYHNGAKNLFVIY